MRVLTLSLAMLALVLAACGSSDPALPTLAPTLGGADGPPTVTPDGTDATDEATSAASAATIAAQSTGTSTRPPASPTTLPAESPSSPQASATPTRRPTSTPTAMATLTSVPTATPLSASLEASPTTEQASISSRLPAARPTIPPYDPASALSAYGQVAPLAFDEHPNKQLFFISGEAQAGWTVGFIDPANSEAQAIYQVAPNASVQTLDLLVPLSDGLRPFPIDQVRLDSPTLAERFSALGFNPSSADALIYTLQADSRGIVWQIQDARSGQRLALDASSGMIVP